MSVLQQLLVGLEKPLIVAAWAVTPLVFAGFALSRAKKAYSAAAIDPFTELPLRPAGESLRAKIDEIGIEFDAAMFGIVMIATTCHSMDSILTT